jgi:GH35 family endo-1,4-beta-xylanase
MDAGCNQSPGFCFAKPQAQKPQGCGFWAAQGIEAEIPEAPGRDLPGAEELERIARFFAALPQKMRPPHTRYGAVSSLGITGGTGGPFDIPLVSPYPLVKGDHAMDSQAFSHRKSRIKLRLVSAGGAPLANRELKVRQTRHQFLFGCGGFEAVELAGGSPGAAALEPRREAFLRDRLDKIFSLHNYATLPFYLGRYEKEEGKPDQERTRAAAEYFARRKVSTKGHPLCWHTACADWLMKYDNREILRRQLARITRDVTAFTGLIDKWDVINEVVIMPIFDKYDNAITRVCKELGRVGMIKEVFAAARAANPGAVLVLNDFNVSIDYEILIDGCLQAGIPIDVIGIQSHQHQGYWGKEKLYEVLDRFSHFGVPLHFTENTLISGEIMPPHIEDLNDWQVGDWPSTPQGEERQARELTEMYEILFACPAVEAITTWSPADDGWLNAPGGFLHADNSVKPVYTALWNKVKGEWWTAETLRTNANGELELEGFRGDYEIADGKEAVPFVLDGTTASLTLGLG